jgi:Ca2+-binding RTX toxin-like protein
MAIKRGTSASETIKGTASADTLYGMGGNDTLLGYGGDDVIYGHDGDDTLWGGADADALVGHAGADMLYGEAGDDKLYGGDGNDFLSGGSGNDSLFGERGNDTLIGGGGVDSLHGGTGDDVLLMDVSGLVTGSNKSFNGDGGTDTLRVNADTATIKNEFGIIPATVSFYAATGTLSFTDGLVTTFVDGGKFSGIERFEVSGATALTYAGGDIDATVTGGAKADSFLSGLGDETFIGGGSADEFYFFGSGGDVDRLVGFDPDEDVIVTTLWSDSNGTPVADRSITEQDGHTIVTTTAMDGTVTHTLDIDAVGLPLDIFKDGYAWV